MPKQEIPDSGGDNINNVIPSKWTLGACPPVWAEPTVVMFNNEGLEFENNTLLSFRRY